MMQTSTVILALGLAACGLAAQTAEEAALRWEQFKGIHGKIYQNKEEEVYRRLIFENNVAKIKKHNTLFLSGLETYSMAVNKFTDMLLSEVVGNGFSNEHHNIEGTSYIPISGDVPKEVDWRKTQGVVTKVKDQGRCGSCWAFSSTGSLEGQLMIRKNRSYSLSEQQLVDCDRETDRGCHGGRIIFAFEYIQKYGLETEDSYPYKAYDSTCKYDKSKVVAGSKVKEYIRIQQGAEDKLINAIAKVGPISVAFRVQQDFVNYDSGVYNPSSCGRTPNHAVLAVGYGHDEETDVDYLIIKNSWGPDWGDAGYVKMARHRDLCGIADNAGYPKLKRH